MSLVKLLLSVGTWGLVQLDLARKPNLQVVEIKLQVSEGSNKVLAQESKGDFCLVVDSSSGK